MRWTPTSLATLIAALVCSLPSEALARRGAPPLSRSQTAKSLALAAAPSRDMPAINRNALLLADQADTTPGPIRFAQVQDVAITTSSDGTWQTLPDGTRLWQLRFESPGATDLNFGFTRFDVAPGTRLYAIAEEEDYYEGPYTAADMKAHGELWLPVVPGQSAVIEVSVPAGAADPDLLLAKIGLGYRDLFKRLPAPKSGSCNNDTVCPIGDPWDDEIRSVAGYGFGGGLFCTGTLLMDVPGTFTPWFLTADHCGLSAGNASSVVVYWNFESPTCGQLGGGSLSDNQTGATFRSAKADVDMALIELDALPDESFNVHYSGWDATGVTPSGSVGIHHPSGDEKAISFNSDPLTTVNNCIGTGGGSIDTHWEVDDWEDGTTEPGSSGSGLWDSTSHLLVGMLSGGSAACPDNNLEDCYGKFSEAWDSGSSSADRLRDWLDPANTGTLSVPGSDPGAGIDLSAFSGTDDCTENPSNEDGIWEPGETIEIPIDLVAEDDFTGVTGTLTSSTPGVTIIDGSGTWPDLFTGVPATSDAPHFTVALGAVPCGAQLSFNLQVSTNEGGPFSIHFSQPVGDDLSPDVPVSIPDSSSATSTVVVAPNVTLTDVRVRVELEHTYVGDLTVTLESPAGTVVTLLDRPGEPASTYGCNDDDMNVTFDDASGFDPEGHCTGSNPWYQGTAAPVQALSAFDGESSAGTWTLTVTDAVAGDTGTIVDWELLATPTLSTGCQGCFGVQEILGKKLILKNPKAGDGPATEEPKRVVIGLAQEKPSPIGGVIGDPTVDGATLRVFVDGTVSSDETYDLDASGWRRIAGGYRFKNSGGSPQPNPISTILIRDNGVKFFMKVVMKGSKGTDDLDVVPASTTPSPPAVQGDLAGGGMLLTLGAGETYCFRLGGADGGVVRVDHAKVGKIVATASAPANTTPGCSAP